MADGDDRQATFGSDGSLETETTPDATGENDFGDEKEANETDGGYSRYVVSSTLQKAVRRSDEEVAAWAAWELARSGYAWNLWDRLNLYVVEDLRAGSDVALTIERYEELATERWDPAEWKGRICAIHAALAAARARSTREASNADAYFSAVAEVRAEARERGEEPPHDFPVGDLEPEGRFDAVFDGHTGEGSKLDRGTRFFKTHGARVGPEGEDEQSARWQRLAMLLDEDVEYDADELDRGVEPVDPENPWRDPATAEEDEEGGGDDGEGDDSESGDGESDDDPTGSLTDFGE
ncbi:hypothetical protein [Halorubrum tebenquichense]|uniref:Uncharacterized protein n=1 Tax=Halorubrum tebenquichense DSM 14210 TaxID=1227485 RepID=M0E1I5_9EURY|nr:hypothetical protein [Halorubrum tebenquichense]ELZ41621.1 hypothetical protein C472_00773 [Halorubrum tebenquichense DSM 14210]